MSGIKEYMLLPLVLAGIVQTAFVFAQQGSLSQLVQNNYPNRPLPFYPNQAPLGNSYALPTSEFRIPLYWDLQKTVVSYADDDTFPPMLWGVFKLPNSDGYLFYVNGEDGNHSTDVVYLTNNYGVKTDSLVVSVDYLKSLSLIGSDGHIVLDSLVVYGDNLSFENLRSSGLSFPGRRVRKTYSVQNGKFHLSQSIYYVPALYSHDNLTGWGTGPLSKGNEAIDYVE